MQRSIASIVIGTCLAFGFAARAEEAKREPVTQEQWLAELRNSVTYREGLEEVRGKVEAAYDFGAIQGVLHWQQVHEHYLELARAQGCKTALPFVEGPLQACVKVRGPEPRHRGNEYREGHEKIETLASKAKWKVPVESVLLSIYDYGYVKGMKHGLRVNNDNLEWKQAYYEACITRANQAKAEPICSRESIVWSKAMLDKLQKQIEGFGTAKLEKQ